MVVDAIVYLLPYITIYADTLDDCVSKTTDKILS